MGFSGIAPPVIKHVRYTKLKKRQEFGAFLSYKQ